MANNKKMVEKVTSRDVDFAKWYTDLCVEAELMSYSSVQGFIIYRPYGYAIWEQIQNYLNNEFKKTNHENVYLPLVIPESLFQKEKDHIEGFAPETAIVTTTGKQDLAEKLIIRPTSEVLFAKHYSEIINSYRDLPKKYNQWCSVVRWEKTTRPFLRGKEFLWQEGHTVHATALEAKKETLDMLEIYKKMGDNLLAIPFVTGQKTEKEKFAGAEATYSIEALMHDGKALQAGTSHYFGDGFAKAFDISFQDKDNKISYGYQTSWGVTTRLIGALIMVHGDDEGLVLPPNVAPIQVVVVPIGNSKEVLSMTKKLNTKLSKTGIRYIIDDSDKRPGWKFSEYEMKGIPLRIEFGERDLENNQLSVFKRNTREKLSFNLEDVNVVKELKNMLNAIHEEMLQAAINNLQNNIRVAKTYDEFKKYLDLGGYVKMSISGDKAEEIIKNETGATARIIPFGEKLITDICPVTNEKAKYTILFARAY